jgi:hypothetical protein
VIRKARPEDLDAIVDLAVEAVSRSPFPVKNDKAAMKETASICLQPAHYLCVSEIGGQVVGALAAQVMPSFWHEKLSCSVLMHYSSVPGEWVKLMKHFSQWVQGRHGIKVAVIELEEFHGEKMIRFIKRVGFSRQSQNLTFVRGMTNVQSS